MAYVTQDIKKQLQLKIMNLLKNNQLRGSLSIKHNYSTLVLKIKDSDNKFNLFTKDCAKDDYVTFSSEHEFNTHKPGRISEENKRLLRKIFNAMKVSDWKDNSCVQSDYFEITYYIDLVIINN